MRTIISVFALLLVLGMDSFSNAQEIKRPEGMLTISPQYQKYADIIKQLQLLPDLIPEDINGDGTCRYVAVINQGLKPAPETNTKIIICKMVMGPDNKPFQICKDEINVKTQPIPPSGGALIMTDFLSNYPGAVALRVIADSNAAVKEADENNNQTNISCRNRQTTP